MGSSDPDRLLPEAHERFAGFDQEKSMFLSIGTPCRLAIGPSGAPILVALDGSRVAFVALTATQAERLAQSAAPGGAGK